MSRRSRLVAAARVRRFRWDGDKIRLEASSDGVLAIAITLLVVELLPRSTPASRPRPVAAVVQLRRLPGELPDHGVICSHSQPPSSPSTWRAGARRRTAAVLYSGVLVLLALAGLALLARVTHDDQLHRLPRGDAATPMRAPRSLV
jgi:hypothetical protein